MSLWAGNSPTVVQKHCQAQVMPKAAREFWSIGPDWKNVIQLPRMNLESAVLAACGVSALAGDSVVCCWKRWLKGNRLSVLAASPVK